MEKDAKINIGIEIEIIYICTIYILILSIYLNIMKNRVTILNHNKSKIMNNFFFFTDEVAGKITLKHLYEIAKIKSEDRTMALLTLEQICNMIVGIARTCGIQIVRDLDPEEYKEFLQNRQQAIMQHDEELRLAKESKMLRTN